MKASQVIAAAKQVSLGEKVQKRARELLRRKNLTIVQLADELEQPPKVAQRIVDRLKLEGYNIQVQYGEVSLQSEIPSSPPLVVNSKDFFDGRRYKFGVLGDTHLCSKYARLDVLRSAYDIFEQEGIKTILHTGNIVEGECRFNRHELVVRSGFEAQCEYLVNEYPYKKGIETLFITGEDHEGWWIQREGINVGARMQESAVAAGRRDLKWIGHIERDIHFKAKNGHAWMRVVHPGGGTAYAISYTTQKIVESYQGGEKPHVVFFGHYHKWEHGYPREVHVIQTGCCQDQTSWMRRKKLQAMVGVSIVDFHQADTGEINRFRAEWLPYFDRGFYDRHNKYQTW
jgi:predicted phosphodiesterase